MTATWCGWPFARVTSARLGRWGSDDVASQVNLCTRCTGRHPAHSSSSSSSVSSDMMKTKRVPPPSTISTYRDVPQVGRSAVSCLRCRAGGSEAFAPSPDDPDIDTRASQPDRGTKRHAQPHPLAHHTPCTARGRARGLWSGVWPKVCVQLVLNACVLRHDDLARRRQRRRAGSSPQPTSSFLWRCLCTRSQLGRQEASMGCTVCCKEWKNRQISGTAFFFFFLNLRVSLKGL